MTATTIQNDAQQSRRFDLFNTVWSVGFLVAIVATWRLWTGSADFAMVPLLEILVDAPLVVDWIALSVAVTACLATCLRASGFQFAGAKKSLALHGDRIGPTSRWLAVALTAALILLFATNQHRLQPWAWQAFLFAVITIAARSKSTAINAARVVMIVIYFYSAIGKMDYQFMHGIGLDFLAVLMRLLGVSLQPAAWVAALLPLGELTVAVLLLFPRSRKSGVVLAGVFHLTLITLLGPWGMDHHAGVLIWNAVNIGLVALLFWPLRSDNRARSRGVTTWKQNAMAAIENHPWLTAVALLIVAMPLFPKCDHWLAWGLYSPGHRRCRMEIVVWADDALPDKLRSYVSAGSLPMSLEVDMGRLSLDRTGAPIYPESRFQYGVARWIERETQLQGRTIIAIESKADHWTGERTSTRVRKASDGPTDVTEFFFNATPRR